MGHVLNEVRLPHERAPRAPPPEGCTRKYRPPKFFGMGNKLSKVNSHSRGIAEMSPGGAGSVKPGNPQPLSSAPPPRLLDQLRSAIRVRHYSFRTESAYVDWARRFILFKAMLNKVVEARG